VDLQDRDMGFGSQGGLNGDTPNVSLSTITLRLVLSVLSV
jgi:hypothetical protein